MFLRHRDCQDDTKGLEAVGRKETHLLRCVLKDLTLDVN